MIRWIGHHLLLVIAAFAIIAAALAGGMAIVRRTVGSAELARTMAELLSEQLDRETARVRIGDVSGNLLTSLVLHDLRVEVKRAGAAGGWLHADAGWMPFFTAREVRLRYAPTELVRGRPRIRELRFVEPIIQLPGPGGTWPRPKARRGPAPPGGGFALAVDQLLLEEAALTRGAGGEAAAFPPVDFTLRTALEIGRGFAALGIDSLGARVGGRKPLVATGRIEVRGSAVYFDRFAVRSGLSHIVIGGGLDGTREARLRVEFDPLALADAELALGVGVGERPGWVRGSASLNGSWQDLEIAFAGEAAYGADRVTGLAITGRRSPEAVMVDQFVLAINGTPLRGSGRIGLGRERARSAGTVIFEGVDLDEFPYLRDLPWLPGGRLSGAVTFGADVGGPGRRLRPFTLEVSGGEVAGFVLEPGSFQGRIGEGWIVELDRYEVTTHGAVIRGAGRIDPRGMLDLEQDLAISDLAALGGMVGEHRFGGRGALHLALAGPVRAPGFTATGLLDSLASGPFCLRRVALGAEWGTIRPRFTFELKAETGGGTVGGQRIDSLAVDFAYAGGRVAARSFVMRRDMAMLRSSGVVEFLPDSTRFDVDAITLSFGELDFRSRGPVRAFKQGSSWRIDALDLGSPHGNLAARGTIDAAGSGTNLDLTARRLDLAALAAAAGGGRRLAGALDLDLGMRGSGPDLELEVAATADSLVLGSFAADRLRYAGGLAGDVLRIDEFRLERGGAVDAGGEIRLARAPAGWRDIPSVLTREALAAAATRLIVRAPALELARWHGLHPTLDSTSGTVALVAELSGPMANPDGALELTSEQLAIAGRTFAPVAARARLAGGQVVVTDSRFGVAGFPFAVSGATPVRLSLTGLPAVDRDGPIDLVFDLGGASLAVATLLTERIAEADGRLDGQVRLAGSLAAPAFSGVVVVRDGRVVVRGREEVMEEITARLALSGQRLEFVDFTATDGAKGRLRARGVLDVTGVRLAGYDVTLSLEQYEVGVTGEYLATIDGTLTFKKGEIAGLFGLPDYSGSVDVRRLDYLREIVGGRSSGEPGPSSWVGRFAIDLPRNAWIRNNDLEVELRGELTYERDVAGPIILGRLETVRGRYDLVGHTFRITSGEIEFNDPEALDPEVNVTAETRVPEARIIATITGRASDRQVVLTSDPDYDQATLWRFLVPTDAEQVTSVALTPFVRDLERSLSRQIPGISVRVESRTLDQDVEPTWGARVGTYVAPELFLSAYQGFSSSSAQDVSVEYELSNIAYLRGSVQRSGYAEGRGATDVDQQYSIDLNLRWEF